MKEEVNEKNEKKEKGKDAGNKKKKIKRDVNLRRFN